MIRFFHNECIYICHRWNANDSVIHVVASFTFPVEVKCHLSILCVFLQKQTSMAPGILTVKIDLWVLLIFDFCLQQTVLQIKLNVQGDNK